MSDKLSTEAYKGVRDFYPEDMAIQKHIFAVWSKVAESYGYEEYSASILEPAEMYSAKTNEEHANEQTYTFTDRGERQVTLRPEMTPTVARMIAGKKRDLAFPVRWYSIPNVFRYERPQRGRLREHWQLNADIFGSDAVTADVEIISMAYDIMRAFGAQPGDFIVRLNSRKIWNTLTEGLALSAEQEHALARLIDKKAKITALEYTDEEEAILGDKTKLFRADMEMLTKDAVPERLIGTDGVKELAQIRALLTTAGIPVVYDPTLMRGFTYYTGPVFEIFDTDPKNPRALFGGGRYDRLLELFSSDKIPAVGFGMGDVTIRDFLETHDLLPKQTSATDLMLCLVDEKGRDEAPQLARHLRAGGVRVAVYEGTKKLGDQISVASKKGIPFIVCIGEKEAAEGSYVLKELATGNEMTLDMAGITAFFRTR